MTTTPSTTKPVEKMTWEEFSKYHPTTFKTLAGWCIIDAEHFNTIQSNASAFAVQEFEREKVRPLVEALNSVAINTKHFEIEGIARRAIRKYEGEQKPKNVKSKPIEQW